MHHCRWWQSGRPHTSAFSTVPKRAISGPVKKLGANIITHHGVQGVHFAVWAPNAKGVAVIGDFNRWNGRGRLSRRGNGPGLITSVGNHNNRRSKLEPGPRGILHRTVRIKPFQVLIGGFDDVGQPDKLLRRLPRV